MKRVAKPEGAYNIVIEEVDIPKVSNTQVLVKAERTLISRGSEIWRRYVRPEAIEPHIMGYSLAGTVVEVGSRVTEFSPGDRVAALAPHAQYVAVEIMDVGPANRPSVVRLPSDVSVEVGTFWHLATSAVLWMQQAGAREEDTMVIQGQGLVGSLCLQVAKRDGPARLIAVDSLTSRLETAGRFGADETVDASAEDPVEAIKRMTDGEGADIVVEAVGGRWGARAFSQAQDMVRRGGLIQVIGAHEGEPLPLDSLKIQGVRLVGGYLERGQRPEASERAMKLLADGGIQAEKMITHRFPFERAAQAFDLLYSRLEEAMGVLLLWD